MATSTKKILVVDDRSEIRDVLKAQLEDVCGYEVFTCTDGRSARELLEKEEHDFDAMILDIMMRTHGGTVGDYVKKHPKYKDALLIFYTGLEESHIDKKILAGAYYIKKTSGSLEQLTMLLNKELGPTGAEA